MFIWCSYLTKNVDIEKHGYSGYGIGSERRSSFYFPGNGLGQNILIFGVDMGSSSHTNDKKKSILVLGKGPTQGLEHTLTAEKMYSIYCFFLFIYNFTVTNQKFCLNLHHNGANSYLFVNGTKFYKFKDSEIVVGPICLGNISKDWPVDNMKRPGFTCYDYDFSVDYEAIAVEY